MCNNQALAGFFTIVKNLVNLIQIIAPILLICSLVYLIIKMMQNPEEKKIPKRILNSCLALVILFFVPLIVEVALNMVDSSSNIGACWKQANGKVNHNSNYIDPNQNSNNKKNPINSSNYEKGDPSQSKNNAK